jgi:hypothetical protein
MLEFPSQLEVSHGVSHDGIQAYLISNILHKGLWGLFRPDLVHSVTTPL